jgi:hypothetical protein
MMIVMTKGRQKKIVIVMKIVMKAMKKEKEDYEQEGKEHAVEEEYEE